MMLENGRTLLPRLKALRDETGHTVFFSLYENGEQVVWEKVDGPGSVLFKAFRGERKRLNISSAGKAIAAFLPPQELKLALQKGLQQATPNSIVSEEDFIQHLAEIRSQGYAIDDEEGEPGVYCIGVPVFTKDRMIYGAVSMSTLKSSLLQKGINQYISAVRSAAEDIGNTL